MNENDLPPLSIKFNNQQFVVIDYWWENNDFVFTTENNESYRFYNAYIASVDFNGLDCTSSEIVEM